MAVSQTISTVSGTEPGVFSTVLAEANEPILIRGLVSGWPVVKCALQSAAKVDEHLRQFYQGASVGVFRGDAAIEGRYFYNENLTGFNFERYMDKLDRVLDSILEQCEGSDSSSYYVGSTTIDSCLPGFRSVNELDFGDLNPLASIWIGNRSRIAAHYDVPDNIACVAAGRRRFTLFPPDQLENLYVGPLDFTPAGQQVSLVDFHRPDFQRFPRFRTALENAVTVDMCPGDALFIPSMWWHHVESLESLNVLVNYWWRKSPDYLGPPIDVLYHALLSLRDLPPGQKKAWRGILDHYIFNESTSLDHIPVKSRGALGELNNERARKLRALLLNRLNR